MSDMGRPWRIPAKHNVMMWKTFVYFHSTDIMRKRWIYKNKMRDNHKEKGSGISPRFKAAKSACFIHSHKVSNMTHQEPPPPRSNTHWSIQIQVQHVPYLTNQCYSHYVLTLITVKLNAGPRTAWGAFLRMCTDGLHFINLICIIWKKIRLQKLITRCSASNRPLCLCTLE